MISHVSLGTNDLERASAFYDELMPVLGARRVMTLDTAIAYGPDESKPIFWIGISLDSALPTTAGNGTHISFSAGSSEVVDAFFDLAIRLGGVDVGAPGPRPAYGDEYYGAFVLDLDGNKIEADCYAIGGS